VIILFNFSIYDYSVIKSIGNKNIAIVSNCEQLWILKIIFYGIIKAYIFLKNKFGSLVKAEHTF